LGNWGDGEMGGLEDTGTRREDVRHQPYCLLPIAYSLNSEL